MVLMGEGRVDALGFCWGGAGDWDIAGTAGRATNITKANRRKDLNMSWGLSRIDARKMGLPFGSPTKRSESENHLQGQLRLTRGSGSYASTYCAGALAEILVVKIAHRIGEIWVVEQIEHF